MRRRALQRYRHVATYLTGDEKSQVDQRITELAAELDKQPDEDTDVSDDADARGMSDDSGAT